MTTQVTVEVPSGADYYVIVDIKEKTASDSFIELSAKISPGDTFSIYIYGDHRFISGIREVKRNQV